MEDNLPGLPQINLEDVRNLELSYSHDARPDKMTLTVEYVGGRLKGSRYSRWTGI
jgi:hypothetical protein